MAPHFSTLAWKIPWMEEPGRLQSMGSLRVRHDWATSLSLFTFMHWRRKWQPTPVFLPGESQGWGNLLSCRLCGVAQSWTRLKRLSSSSSSLKLATMEVFTPQKLANTADSPPYNWFPPQSSGLPSHLGSSHPVSSEMSGNQPQAWCTVAIYQQPAFPHT